MTTMQDCPFCHKLRHEYSRPEMDSRYVCQCTQASMSLVDQSVELLRLRNRVDELEERQEGACAMTTLPTLPNGAIDWSKVWVESSAYESHACWQDDTGQTHAVGAFDFSKLVAEHVREQAAKVADWVFNAKGQHIPGFTNGMVTGAEIIRNAIREMEV